MLGSLLLGKQKNIRLMEFQFQHKLMLGYPTHQGKEKQLHQNIKLKNKFVEKE
jgi:hypothetical protein